MKREEVSEILDFYPDGTVFDVKWDRGNGTIDGKYVLIKKGKEPLLYNYEEGKNLDGYHGNTLDIFCEGMFIEGLVIDAAESDKLLG